MINDDPSIKEAPTLLSRLVSETRALAASEIALAKREISRKISKAGGAIGMLVAAALLALVAFNALAAAAVFGLVALDVSAGWSALIVAGVLCLLALILGLTGRSRLRAEALKPEKTVRNVKADVAAVKEATRG